MLQRIVMHITFSEAILGLEYLSFSDPISNDRNTAGALWIDATDVTLPRVYFNFQSNKKFFHDYFSTCFVSGDPPSHESGFVSRSFSATSYVSAIFHGANVTPSAIFPSWSFPIAHPPSPPPPLSSFLAKLLSSLSPYRRRFPVPFTRLISCYLLQLPSPA